MEDQLCITLPKPVKIEASGSVRTKKYIRIYSSNKSKSKNTTQRNLKLSEVSTSIHPNRSSYDGSRLVLNTSSIQSLQQYAKSLLYDVQKSISDKFELIRDLSTYDYNFSKEQDLLNSLSKLNEIARPLPDAADLIEKIIDKENFSFSGLVSGLSSVASMDFSNSFENSLETETFNIKNISLAQILAPVYAGSLILSGIYCLVSLTSDKWLENLYFHVSMLNGTTFFLQKTQTMSNSYYTSDQIKEVVKTKLLPRLSFYKENKEISLIFDKSQGVNYYTLLCKVRGYELCNVQIITKSENCLLIEIPSLEQTLLANLNENAVELFNDKRKLAKVVEKQLIFCRKRKSLFWGEEIFEESEKNSKFFNEDYLKQAMGMGNYNQIYSIYLPNFDARIECFECKGQIILRATFDKETVDIDSLSKNFYFLQEFQDFTVLRSPKTLISSLEFETLLIKIFPRMVKNKISK